MSGGKGHHRVALKLDLLQNPWSSHLSVLGALPFTYRCGAVRLFKVSPKASNVESVSHQIDFS